MPASFLENDITHMTNSLVFGELVTWRGQSRTVIFDDEDIEVTLGEGVAQIIEQASITGRTSDFQGIARGDAVVVRSKNYRVANWKRDGGGMIEIFLEQV